MKNIWKKIQTELHKISPEIAQSFNPAASQEQIKALETALGSPLPSDFKSYLSTFNGQNHQFFKILFFGYNVLMPIDEILAFYQMQTALFADEKPIEWIKPNKIQPKIWDKGWIPFANYEGASQYIFIDLNPAKNGTYGQIVQLWTGIDMEDDEVVIALSFTEFSQKILEILQQKNYTFANDGSIENDFLV